jgi:ribosomal protein L11 methylase PrmA
VRYAAELRSLVVEGGYLILSGFAAEDAPVVRMAFADFDVIAEEKEADWGGLTLRKTA